MSVNHGVATRSVVRVLVVDDSAFMRTALSRMIASDPEFEVVGTARDGADALSKIATLNPDVITLDVQMPGIDGLETLRRIMSQFPRPVIMVSSVTERDARDTFTALSTGAFDYVPKRMSDSSLDIQHIREDLIGKIRAAALSRKSPTLQPQRKPPQATGTGSNEKTFAAPSVIALGASTGGPRALEEILPLLPGNLTVPILIVQHMPAGFTGTFAKRLNSMCAVKVREAVHDEPILPGTVYIAPAGKHMTVHRNSDSGTLINLDVSPGTHVHMPSVDVLMKSVAHNFRSLAMGVILTGMGVDGTEGMKEIRSQGGLTIGQDEASCAVFGMPRACAEAGALARVVPLSQIPQQIMEATRFRKRA